jgi:glycosyltransferase involved in cell wall biosynthesis
MAAAPLVSVLVPLYNHARYVRRCLDSVLEDGYPRIEIVIIDDGSKDASVAIARQWFEEQDPARIERFDLSSRPNKGVTRTVNELVGKARGDYLVMLASDDYLLPGGIEVRLEYLRQHPPKLAVFGDCTVVDADGTQTHQSGIADLYSGRIENLMNDDLLALELIFNWCIPGPGFLAHREVFERIGLYDESLAVEDWDMYLRIAAKGLLGFTPCAVAAYRWHAGNSVVNEGMKLSQLESSMRTARKNNRAFQGVQRFGLVYKWFKLKQDIAVAQHPTLVAHFNRGICKLVYRRVFKLLYRLTVLRYRRSEAF